VADAYGLAGFRITRKEDVVPGLKRAREIDGPVLIEFQVVDEENVYPMVPSGGSISEMLRRPIEETECELDEESEDLAEGRQ
jgi:acetolactate synthase-1/2/3 large subunit